MECNKDEAIRAKKIAESKMQSNDYEGARKIAMKAKNLYPELENINQMLSICEVHCSAQRRLLGSDKDWYGVLQVEKLADEVTIKKQYRRLALILHPDKNQLPGAEGAFKLISEAHALLSDPAKKSTYDNKIKVLERSAPPNRGQSFHTGNGVSREKQHQSSVFWTCCPYCKVSYQYLRQFINRSLPCQTCLKTFITYEVHHQGVPTGSKSGNQSAPYPPSKPDVRQPSAFQAKAATEQVKSEINMKKAKVPSTSHAGPKVTANKKTAQPQPAVQKRCGAENLKSKETVNLNASDLRDEKVDATSNGHAKSKIQKRRRKSMVQSSDSSDTDIDDMVEQVNLGDAATDMDYEFTLAEFSRKSSRIKQNVSYTESDEGGHSRPLKRAQTTKEEKRKEQKNSDFGEDSKNGNLTCSPLGKKEAGASHSQESLKEEKEGCDKEGEMRGVTGDKPSAAAADTVEIISDSDLDSSPSKNSDCFDCPDPDFSDFDKLRDESLFDVNQVWACYDDTYDGMPRFYAKVVKVFPSPFELQIKWLEAKPINDAYERWVDEELPVGCGSFKLMGKPEKVSGCLSLSHQVRFETGKKKGSHFIYPREGEVWALFRDWDIGWSTDPESHLEFRYEVVEVLSDFAAGVGINVRYLDKVTGFVSLFIPSEKNSFLIGHSELYKFSHCVPSFKMTGNEREGVPIGSFELDPAALPQNPDDLYFPSKENIKRRNVDPTVTTSPPKGKGKSAAKIVDMEGEASKVRRSPRAVKGRN